MQNWQLAWMMPRPQAKVCCTTTACALQQAHRDNVLALESKTKAEEGQNCQAFVEAFGVAIQACPPKSQGTLLYSLQLLTVNVLLATILVMSTTAQLWAVADGGLALAASLQVYQRHHHHKQVQNADAIPQTKVCLSQGRRKRRWQTLMKCLKNIFAVSEKREGWQWRP